MTQEKMEGHEPHGHSYVWDAHMKRREREKPYCWQCTLGVELYTRMKKKGNGVLGQIAL